MESLEGGCGLYTRGGDDRLRLPSNGRIIIISSTTPLPAPLRHLPAVGGTKALLCRPGGGTASFGTGVGVRRVGGLKGGEYCSFLRWFNVRTGVARYQV